MTETERQAEQARKNQRAHQAAEAAALLLLTRARSNAVKAGGSVYDIANGMQPRMRDAIVLLRNGSRSRGIVRLTEEVESLGMSANLKPSTSALIRDWTRASEVGRSYASRWLRKAETLGKPLLASKATQGSLERIGITESSHAFTTGRTEALQRADVVGEINAVRIWDASLDKRTCPTCSAANGTIVGANESFPLGEPGSVHAGCRCSFTLSTVSLSGRPRR
jgi:hypothetical protein